MRRRASRSLLAAILLVVSSYGVACQSEEASQDQQDVVMLPAVEEQGEMSPGEEDVEPVFEPPVIQDWETLEDQNEDPDIVEVHLRAELTEYELAPGVVLPMMTYNGQFPGPLLQAKVGDRVIVHFENALEEETTIHWHGLRISDEMDGSPRIQAPVQPGESFDYDFVVPEAGTFWYHPHVRAHEQVGRGLYGPLVVHDPADPVVDAERVIIVDDVLLSGDDFVPFLASRHERVHGRTGNTLLLNGTNELPAQHEAAGGVERWRIINTTNARTFVLSVPDTRARVIGTDGGLLAEPYEADRLEVAVGQRYDLEVSHTEGSAATLTAHVLTLDESEQVVEAEFPLYEVTARGLEASGEALDWSGQELPWPLVDREVEVVLDAADDIFGNLRWSINGQHGGMEPIFEFEQGEVVTMNIRNMQGPEHPFHLHGQFFTVLDDGSGSEQPGLRDTVLVPGRSTVRIIAYMDNPGMWMAHCHILEHAAVGMMSEIRVHPTE